MEDSDLGHRAVVEEVSAAHKVRAEDSVERLEVALVARQVVARQVVALAAVVFPGAVFLAVRPEALAVAADLEAAILRAAPVPHLVAASAVADLQALVNLSE